MKVNRKFLLGIAVCMSQWMSGPARAEEFVIALESAGVRSKPQFFAPVQSTLPYGTRVTIVSTDGAWVQIQNQGGTGWIHKSAFAKAAPILHDIGKGAAASKDTYKDEVVTAGKGFSETSEASKAPSDLNFQFHFLDQIESREVSTPQLKEFMNEGRLKSRLVGE